MSIYDNYLDSKKTNTIKPEMPKQETTFGKIKRVTKDVFFPGAQPTTPAPVVPTKPKSVYDTYLESMVQEPVVTNIGTTSKNGIPMTPPTSTGFQQQQRKEVNPLEKAKTQKLMDIATIEMNKLNKEIALKKVQKQANPILPPTSYDAVSGKAQEEVRK